MLDVRTLLFTNFTYSLIVGFGFYMTYREFTGDIRASMRTLAVALSILSTGWIFLSLRDYIPTSLSIIIGNLGLLIGEIEIYHAMRIFDGCKFRRRPRVLLVILTMLLVVYFYFIVENINVRIIAISLFSAYINFITGMHLIRRQTHYSSKIRKLTGFACIALALTFLVRMIDASIFSPLLPTIMINSFMQIMVYGGVLVASFAMIFGYVLMCTQRFNYELNQQAIIDPLTNMYNRRGVENFLQREIELVRRSKDPLALLIIDANQFKGINDQFGHAAGDQALIYIGETLKSNIRSGDLAGRLGGDEFVLVLTRTNLDTAQSIAERIKTIIDSTPLIYENKQIPLSVSIGVGMLDIEHPNYDALFVEADNSLYKEKEKYHQTREKE